MGCTELIGKMVSDMPAKTEISPTLREIICQFDEDNQRSQIFSLGEDIDFRLDGLGGCANACHTKEETFVGNEDGLDDSSFGNHKAWGYDQEGGTSVVNESSSFHPTFPGDHEEFVTFLVRIPAYSSPIDYMFLLLLKFSLSFLVKCKEEICNALK